MVLHHVIHMVPASDLVICFQTYRHSFTHQGRHILAVNSKIFEKNEMEQRLEQLQVHLGCSLYFPRKKYLLRRWWIGDSKQWLRMLRFVMSMISKLFSSLKAGLLLDWGRCANELCGFNFKEAFGQHVTFANLILWNTVINDQCTCS